MLKEIPEILQNMAAFIAKRLCCESFVWNLVCDFI